MNRHDHDLAARLYARPDASAMIKNLPDLGESLNNAAVDLAKRLYERFSLTQEEATALFEWGYLNDCLQRPLESNEHYLERLRRTKALAQKVTSWLV